MLPLVYIVLLNYNGYEDTLECVNSLKNIKYENYKIVIVDNGSVDNSEKKLRSALSECVILQAGSNLGFAGGNNVGIKYALSNDADYIMLLNNDTAVDENLLNKMLDSFKRNSTAGIVGGKIFYYDDRNYVSHAGGYIDFFKFITVHYGMNEKDSEKLNIEGEVGFISGCLMLIKAEVFKKAGLLSEEYFMYYEDTDFCIKVSDYGYKLIYNPEAIIYHKMSKAGGGENSPFFIKWNTRNRLLFMKKFKYKTNHFMYIFSLLYFYITRFIRICIYLIRKDKERQEALLEGIKEGRNL